ncbi:MAG TPA: tRNA-binding protein [Bacteroidales bacterium]|nr:tRNA-binding protein [Bacteroidales bacterium]
MDKITWEHFEAVELRVGRIVDVQEFPEASKPAYKIWADFGDDYGILKSSAQITALYDPEELIGREIIGLVNIPPRQIGPLRSEFLVTGFTNERGEVVLAMPERPVEPGARLH